MATYEFERRRIIQSREINSYEFRAFNKDRETDFYFVDALVARIERFPVDESPLVFVSSKTEKRTVIVGDCGYEYSPATDDDLLEITQKYLKISNRKKARNLLNNLFPRRKLRGVEN